MRIAALTAAATLAATGAFAEGDIAAGEKAFKKCQACHSIVDAEGNSIAGKGKSGPNLWGVVGSVAGTQDFNYKPSIVAAGEKGLVWDEEELVKYLADPAAYLQAYLEDDSARSGMSYKSRKEQESRDVVAYLAQFGPAAE